LFAKQSKTLPDPLYANLRGYVLHIRVDLRQSAVCDDAIYAQNG
jgi:hypothetical protein